VRAEGIRSSKVISLDKHEMLNHMLFFDENAQRNRNKFSKTFDERKESSHASTLSMKSSLENIIFSLVLRDNANNVRNLVLFSDSFE